MAVSKTKGRYPLILFFTLLLLIFTMAACTGMDTPSVLSSEGEAIEEGEIVGGAPGEEVPGEEVPVEVEDADVASLATDEAADDTGEEAGEATVTPEGVAAVPEGGAVTDEGLAAEIGFTDVLVGANYFVNRDVEDLDGDVIATVDDLVLDLGTGRIVYVIVNYGGLLGLGDEDRPMPLSAFGWNADLELVLRLSEDVLEAVPAVDDDWPAETDSEWNTSMLAYWQDAGFMPDVSPETLPIRATELIGLHAGQLGTDLGVIEDLLLDLNHQQVAYLGIFTTDDFYSPDLVLIVPFSATELQIQDVGNQPPYALTLLAIDPEVLTSAPALDRGLFSSVDFIDQSFTQELNTFWSEQGFEVGTAE